MALIPSQSLKGFSFPSVRFMVADLTLPNTAWGDADKEGNAFKKVLQNWQVWILRISNSATHKGNVKHAIFTACVNTGLRYCNTGRERAENLAGSGSHWKSCESKKDPISLCLPLLPNSQLRTGQRPRKKVGALHLKLEMGVFQRCHHE